MKDYSKDEIRENFKLFFEEEGLTSEIIRVAENYPDDRSIDITYAELMDHFDVEFPEYVHEQPRICLDLATEAINEILGSSYEETSIRLRINDLPEAHNKGIRELRAGDLSKFIGVKGLVRKATEVRPRLTTAVFQCMRCGANIKVEQSAGKIEEPMECQGCGKSSNKTSFKLVLEESKFTDYQTLEIQESPEDLRGGEQPQRLKGWTKEDLVGIVSPGDRIVMNGILDGTPKSGPGGSKSRTFNIFMRLNSIEVQDYEYKDVKLSEEDKEEIMDTSKDPRLFSKLVGSIAPSIQGMNMIKTGLALQLFSGVKKKTPDGSQIRGDIHILLVGDPGTAKSQLLRYISDLTPRGMYASGKGTTGAGLTAAAVREEVMGESQWILEAGTLVLADNGIAAVDELDKMREEDRSAMHEAMEQQSISVAKAGINARLNSRCAVLGAANPEFGRFERHENISQQIKLPPPLISRFDLIFAIMDEPNKEKDRDIAEHILELHQVGEKMINDETYEPEKRFVPPLSKDFLKKYVSYAKTVNPVMTDEAREELEKFYLDIRASGGNEDAIPITARQLESLVRLSESSARAHLRKKVTTEDAKRAINVTRYFLNEVASTSEGGLDIDFVASDVSSSERTIMHDIRDIIKELEQLHDGVAPEEEIMERGEKAGISQENIRKELEKMRRNGQIYCPSTGKYKFS
ncbi:MAG: minichromosome maintenance protein MCM [Candidatus Saliniplasma sp.]